MKNAQVFNAWNFDAIALGWSPDGHRIQAPLEYRRGTDKDGSNGALCVRNGHELTLTVPSRNAQDYVHLLDAIDQAYPQGDVF